MYMIARTYFQYNRYSFTAGRMNPASKNGGLVFQSDLKKSPLVEASNQVDCHREDYLLQSPWLTFVHIAFKIGPRSKSIPNSTNRLE